MKATTLTAWVAAGLGTVVMGFHLVAGARPQTQPPPAPGGRGGQAGVAANANPSGSRLDRIKVYGASLEGNLEGDDPNRDVVVYLPPSYSKEPARRYPVVYFLHGYTVRVEAYVRLLRLQEAADKAIAGGVREMILARISTWTRPSHGWASLTLSSSTKETMATVSPRAS